MTTWDEPQVYEIPQDFQDEIGGHPLVAKTLLLHGFSDPGEASAFLDPERYSATPATQLPGLDKAAVRLHQAICAGERICVWGDFDVDGQTATTVLVSTLEDLGASVFFHIPVRATESHGVSLPVLREKVAQGADLILTCDTGITAHAAVEFAQERGIDFIISDHHDLPADLPPAYAIINPKQLPGTHPLATLPGVGVAYKLAEELYQRAGRSDECQRLLDLAALGIVADLAIQTGETRYLLQCGLQTLRATQRKGLQAMMELVELDPKWLTEEHIGFILGPRLNALGRLADANLAVEFLTTGDPGRARLLAHELEGLNLRRKLLTDQVYKGALAQIDNDPGLAEKAAIVLAQPTWPAGVIGIVASRLVERFHKPAVLIASPPGELARGSARSVEGINITAAIASQGDLLAGFGGHPMAAGLTIDPDRIPQFREALSQTVRDLGKDLSQEISLQIEAYIPLDELTLETVSDLERLAPFGPGNPPLILASRDIEIAGHRTVGRGAEHRLVTVADRGGHTQQVIWWGASDLDLPVGSFDLAYTARSSTFRGKHDIQVEWVDARPAAGQPVEIMSQPSGLQVIDYRGIDQPEHILRQLRLETGYQFWAEGQANQVIPGVNRYDLVPSPSLVICAPPPGPAELQQVLNVVKPERVLLFSIGTQADQIDDFLNKLAGLIKYALKNKQGKIQVSSLAGATAQREKTVILGIAWLEAQGHIEVTEHSGDTFLARMGDQIQKTGARGIKEQLQAILQETAAFRNYYLRASKDILLSNMVADSPTES